MASSIVGRKLALAGGRNRNWEEETGLMGYLDINMQIGAEL